jgi:poly-beta-1,6-N-acetyl-D-glucosamine N-deacetylase
MTVRSALIYALLTTALIGCDQPDRRIGSAPSVDPTTSPSPTAPVWKDISLKAQTARVPVIMYHDVIERRGRKSEWFDVTKEEFEKQMKTIADAGGKTLTMDELYKHLTDGDPVPQHSVVLTFDDNYQGVNDIAVPILRQYNFKATVFVHTGFVGNKTQGRPKMDWPTLASLIKEGVMQVEDHTITHPTDITKLTEDQQRHELEDSKKDLETHLGIKVDYLAYPTGNNDETTRRIAKELGYKMAFTMKGDAAEVSPDILRVNRFEQTKFDTAWEACETENNMAPLGVSQITLHDAPITFREGKFDGSDLIYVMGGKPMTVLGETRQSVGQFVAEAKGVAGINGTFFSMAAISATDNKLIGPSKVPGGVFLPDIEPDRLPKLRDRPVIFWNGTTAMIAPFAPGVMNTEDPYKAVMPDYTDLFMSGAWIVKGGIARTADQMKDYASKDIEDPRRRAFFGFMADGTMIAGASKGSVSTEALARAVVAAGGTEAILLDSGFSTSLVFDGKVLASGHSDDTNPSRPVPHAIVFMGEKDPSVDTSALIEDNGKAGQGGDPATPRRRRRHRRPSTPTAPDTNPAPPSVPDTAPPPTTSR